MFKTLTKRKDNINGTISNYVCTSDYRSSIPASFSLDASMIPIAFMLIYQWTLNRNKNYYLYAMGLCVIFTLLYRPSMATFGFFHATKGINFFYLFLGYMTIMLLSKWITDLFLHFQREPKHSSGKHFILNRIFLRKTKAK